MQGLAGHAHLGNGVGDSRRGVEDMLPGKTLHLETPSLNNMSYFCKLTAPLHQMLFLVGRLKVVNL